MTVECRFRGTRVSEKCVFGGILHLVSSNHPESRGAFVGFARCDLFVEHGLIFVVVDFRFGVLCFVCNWFQMVLHLRCLSWFSFDFDIRFVVVGDFVNMLFTLEDWKKVTIKVIHKKGDVENVSNYRPICSLPALYNVFSTISVRKIKASAWPETSRRSGSLQNILPDKRPPCNIQIDWTLAPNKEHERMIQSTQRKMLRFIIQTKRKYKKIEKQDIGTKEENE